MDTIPPQPVPTQPPDPVHPPTLKRGIDWKFQFQQYGTAVILLVGLCILLSWYLYARGGSYDAYLANRVLAGSGALMFGIVLLIGPLTRWFKVFDHYLQYRKEIGIVGFVAVLVHVILSFFFLRERFPLERFVTTGLWPFIYGFLATAMLVILFSISNLRSMKALGGKMWWFLQSWGVRTIFVLSALHVFVMKWSGWIDWYQGDAPSRGATHPDWPSASLLVAWFVAFIVFIRISELINARLGKIAWYVSLVGFPVAIIGTFIWGQTQLG